MQFQTFCLDNSSPSNTRPDFVQDPQKSLVILFGASSFLDSPERVQEVCHTFSGIPVIVCVRMAACVCLLVLIGLLANSFGQFKSG